LLSFLKSGPFFLTPSKLIPPLATVDLFFFFSSCVFELYPLNSPLRNLLLPFFERFQYLLPFRMQTVLGFFEGLNWPILTFTGVRAFPRLPPSLFNHTPSQRNAALPPSVRPSLFFSVGSSPSLTPFLFARARLYLKGEFPPFFPL